jgi:hypothetical protein
MTNTNWDDDAELLRLRQVVAEYYGVVLLVLVLVAGAGAWAGYTAYVDPGVETEERTVSTWSRTATFSHSAEVTRRNPIYSTGLRLTNRQAYFPQVAPVLEGEHQFSYTATTGGSVDVLTDVQLLVQSGEDGTVFWQSTQTLSNRETAGVRPDQPVVTRYRFNMSRVQARLDRMSDTLGDTPGETEVVVRAETRLTGEINGRTIDRRFVDDLRLIPDGDTFLVSDPGQVRNSSRQVETITRERTYSLLWRAGAPLLVVLGLGGTGGLLYGRRNGLLSVDPDRLDRTEYDEWISHGTLPSSVDPDGDNAVAVDSLGDLVDVAADIDERVLFDADRDCYAVLDAHYHYLYQPTIATDTGSGGSSGDGSSPSVQTALTDTELWDSEATVGTNSSGAASDATGATSVDVDCAEFGAPSDVDESDLCDEIRQFAEVVSKSPTEDLVVAYGRYPADAYQTTFGSWEAALDAAGCDPDDVPNQSARSKTNVDVLDEIRAVAEELGRAPTTTETGERVDFSPGLASLRFGSWEAALETAGLEPPEQHSARDGAPASSADGENVTDSDGADGPS